MITIKLTVEDLARIRFAISPMGVTTISYRTVLFPDWYKRHREWATQAVAKIGDADLTVLGLVHPDPRGFYIPDFLTPIPRRPMESVEAEIEMLARTSIDVLRADADEALHAAYSPRDAARITHFVKQVPTMRDQLTADIWHYWEQVVRPSWREIEAILEGDILFHTQQMGKFGVDHMLANLAHDVAYSDGLLTINTKCQEHQMLTGQGIVLCPNPFAHRTWFQCMGDGPIMLIYPARGAGNLRKTMSEQADNTRLSAMIGVTKAQILGEADHPISTIELAERLSLTSGAVSQHIGQLHTADLKLVAVFEHLCTFDLLTVDQNAVLAGEVLGRKPVPVAL
ncbi:MAG: hypothetical protein AAF125_26715, partial [Chloroflexota bacterium]